MSRSPVVTGHLRVGPAGIVGRNGIYMSLPTSVVRYVWLGDIYLTVVLPPPTLFQLNRWCLLVTRNTDRIIMHDSSFNSKRDYICTNSRYIRWVRGMSSPCLRQRPQHDAPFAQPWCARSHCGGCCLARGSPGQEQEASGTQRPAYRRRQYGLCVCSVTDSQCPVFQCRCCPLVLWV